MRDSAGLAAAAAALSSALVYFGTHSGGIAMATGLIIVLFYAVRRGVELARENRGLMKQVEDATQMKKDFISYVSHELKAPLASMQETTHLLLEKIPGELTSRQQRLLDLNLQNGKKLAGMIGNLLDLSRLEAGAADYRIQRQDLGELVRSVIGRYAEEARQAEIRIVPSIPSTPVIVHCDATRMAQMLSEILKNALLFSARNGVVHIDVRSDRCAPARTPAAIRRLLTLRPRPHGFATVSVADAGPGIEDHQKERIFQTFYRVAYGRKQHAESLGLGLSIARLIAEAHRGAIWVEDNPRGGSVFSVLLPLGDAG